MPTISVIIPVFNVEKYLRRCLDSIANQTYADWEAICVNDGSTDSSLAILHEYANRDARFKIIDKPNGGLSDARNAGLKVAAGDYINYVDSDDLIHPQTFEIALALAQRNDSDIVSWYKDPHFRLSLIVRRSLGFNIDNALPRGLQHRFNLDEVDSYTTNDAIAHAVQGSGRGMQYPLKRFYVWRHLLRRRVALSVQFVKGLYFEDFPWWSEVLLLNPRVTITRLPFYYYFPNFRSIDLGSKRSVKMGNWIKGIEHTWSLYQARATAHQQACWERQLLWPTINGQIAAKMVLLRSEAERAAICEGLAQLWKLGVFAAPPDKRSLASQRRIARFIEKS